MNSFTEKKLRATLILAGTNAVFPGTNSNTLVIENLRMSAQIQAVARLSTQAELKIYGMRQTDMNALTVAWANPPVVLDNVVIIEANDTGKDTGWTQVFKGTIIEAQPDYSSQPDVGFALSAMTGYYQKINAAVPISYPEDTTVGVIVADIVALMGDPWTLVLGEGIDAVIQNAYYWGTLWDQLAQACADGNCDFYIQGDEILVVKAGEPRNTVSAAFLSAQTGLISSPIFERSGLAVNALFNPAFLCGTPVQIESTVPNATGRWFPYALFHTLDSNVPGGAWFTQMKCLRVLV